MSGRKTESNDSNWKFWIDVGGTFTDCVAQSPAGIQSHLKVLSTSTTKGAIDNISTEFVVDRSRPEKDNFWQNYECRLIDRVGETIANCQIASFDSRRRQFSFDRRFEKETIERTAGFELNSSLPSAIFAVRKLLELRLDESLPDLSLHLGTTRGTNALLTRTGGRTVWATTQGFADILAIGDQSRPDLFALDIVKPKPLYDATIEIDQRIAADGSVLKALNQEQVAIDLASLHAQGFDSIAICFLHSYQYPEHEKIVARIAREVGFKEVSVSHVVTPTIKIVARGQTTVLDAYLNPLLSDYVLKIRKEISAESQLRLMTSTGGLVLSEQFTGKDSVLSGPAGGVVGFAKIAAQLGFKHVIGLDMGGTSTDVARFDGTYERQFETTKAGVKIVHPLLAIETVAAGGGSICWIDDGRMAVGPQSAGADPGPACYGRGGPLTITDVNLFLGRIDASKFPFDLDASAVDQRLSKLANQLKNESGVEYSKTKLAQGFFKVAVNHMAKAIHKISVARGYDPRDYVLVGFGGASPQVACAIADELGIKKIINHPRGSVLSAVGCSLADTSTHRVRSIGKLLDLKTLAAIEPIFEEATLSAREQLLQQSISADQIQVSKFVDLRYQGTDAFLTIPCSANNDYETDFAEAHRKRYGYIQNRKIEIVSLRVEAMAPGRKLDSLQPPTAKQIPATQRQCESFFGDKFIGINSFQRCQLQSGDELDGPAMITDENTCTMIDPGWRGTVFEEQQLVIERMDTDSATERKPSDSKTVDPVMLEVFYSNFGVIAEQMGLTLRNTAISVNVKERLDFSCAIFNRLGELVVNAPHIPVHLGAMSETVKAVIDHFKTFADGDVIVTNDPYRGGSHLPDVTVITPVFVDGTECDFFVASRCHHAEIGGKSPGSMPPDAKVLGEEGVLISNFKVVDAGENRLEQLRKLLTSGKFPSRSPNENIADISAQIAANKTGGQQLIALSERYGRRFVLDYMKHCLRAAENKIRAALKRHPDGEFKFIDSLDCGAVIRVKLTVFRERMTIDFTGTSDVQNNNLNANRGIVTAAVIYCLRLMMDQPIPLNDGMLRPISLILPTCFLNPAPAQDPLQSPPVVGGNVETSQRIVDVLIGALQLAAASQGTMNNLLIGDESFGYYETICGGAGATKKRQGADAVQTHMTNTRITDPEVLETRFPLRLHRFEIRRGSGGAGKNRGGNGVIREIELLKDLEVSILSNRRGENVPWGLCGGQAGTAGKNTRVTETGSKLLGHQVGFLANAGDRIIIETPGGGGYGE